MIAGSIQKARPIKLGVVAGFLLVALSAATNAFNGLDPELPQGIPFEVWAYFVPSDNAVTADKVDLGRELFLDPRLSRDSAVSCASCHDPERAFTDGKQLAEGIGGRKGKRNSPTLMNAMFNSGQFWDGRATSLEQQARLPLTNPDEMGNTSLEEVVDRLRAVPRYVLRFRQVFGSDVTIDSLARAIAAFERTLVSGDSPFDRFNSGDTAAMSSSAIRGLGLFRGKARCTVCHAFSQFGGQTYQFFSDQLYHNTGVAANDASFDLLARKAIAISRVPRPAAEIEKLSKFDSAASLGRFLVTANSLDIGAFKTPSLRDVELTAPYFHDGSARTLNDVLKFYLEGGKANLNRDWELHPISLTEDEQADLIAFLKSLTSSESRRAALGPKKQ